MSCSQRPVVVGVDGSPDARCALEWAVVEAAAALTSLKLIHVVPEVGSGVTRPGRDCLGDALVHAERMIRQDRRTVTVSAVARRGDPAEVLVAESCGAALMCVGAGGGGLGHPVGSIPAVLAGRARCPVAIIRPEAESADVEGVIAVVLDDDPDNDVVVHCAMQEGRRRAMIVRQIDRRVASWVRRYPDVPVELVAGGAARGRSEQTGFRPVRLAVVGGADADTIAGRHRPTGHSISGFPDHCSMLVIRGEG